MADERSADHRVRSVAVIGAGWAGLAAAVRLQTAGSQVTLFESASAPGGRARSVIHHGQTLDNGQHILIGAYKSTLALMRKVGVDPASAFHRRPLALVDPQGRGLRLPGGPAPLALLWGFARLSDWPVSTRMAWIGRTMRWMSQGMRCEPATTVADLCEGLPAQVMQDLVDPLCVAALNTESRAASGAVFLRVLVDALLSGQGSADLLLPRVPLGMLLPVPAVAWLKARGADVRWRHRVRSLVPHPAGASGGAWRVDGEPFDATVLACPPWEAVKLTLGLAPRWANRAQELRHEPITTVTLDTSVRVAWGGPMVRLREGPAQFAFDLARIGHSQAGLATEGPPSRSRLTFVISASTPWIALGGDEVERAVLEQAKSSCPRLASDPTLRVISQMTEKRATFRCVAGLTRPSHRIAPGLWAAGDYVDGPYPATLEGAVRSGEQVAAEILVEQFTPSG